MGNTARKVGNIPANSLRLAKDIHHLLLFYQYRNKFLSQAYQQSISLHDSHLLAEIDGNQKITAKKLIELQLGSQSFISRRLSSLSNLGYIKTATNMSDARSTTLALSAKGTKILQSVDRVANGLIALFKKHLTQKEATQLSKLINTLCDYGETPKGTVRKSDAPLRPEFRRLARFMGVLLPSFMDSDLSSTEWQILQAIRYSTPLLSAGEISQQFQIEQSTLSRILSRFQKLRYVAEVQDATDARIKRLQILSSGQKVLDSIDKQAAIKIASALSELPTKEQSELVSLLAKFTFGSPKNLDSLISTADESKLDQLRRAYLEGILGNSKQRIPCEILNPENLILVPAKDPGMTFIEVSRDSRIVNCNFDFSFGQNYLDRLFFIVTALRHAALTQGSTFRVLGSFDTAFLDFKSLFGVTFRSE